MIINEAWKCSFSLETLWPKIYNGDFVDHEAHFGGILFGVFCTIVFSFISFLLSFIIKI